MVKLLGTILLLFMSALTGSFAAEGLKARVRELKQLRLCLESLRLMIRYEALEVTEIVRRLSEDSTFSGLAFIAPLKKYTDEACESGKMTFGEAWDKALSENRGSLSEEDIALASRAGKILGSCDCDGQLSALTLLCEEADRLIMDAKEQYMAKGKLYRALGAITGAVIAVIVV
ncbi:MAG: stage III sporulation protein AB [Oscillospiraceae bacterium]|nr:stage III sporulation protein AB [Oscillospiraceae bacterium]